MTDAIRNLGEWNERDNQLCYESWRPVLDYWHSKSTLSALGYQKTATTLEDFKVNRVNTNNRQFKVVDQGLWKSIQNSFTNEVNLRHGITQAQLSLEESTYFGQSFSTSSNENLTNKWNNYYDGSDDDRKNDENLYRLVPK